MRVEIIPLVAESDNDGMSYIAFFPDSLRFFEVNKQTSVIISRIVGGASFPELQQDYPLLKKEDYNKICDYGTECAGVKNPVDSKTLGRLVINISNKCNLRCKYCYANSGSYGNNKR